MTGGIDRGACWIYWRLSYRRKFIRTLWFVGIGTPLLLLIAMYGATPGTRAAQVAWWAFAWSTAVGALQAGYTYYRWRKEIEGPGRDAE